MVAGLTGGRGPCSVTRLLHWQRHKRGSTSGLNCPRDVVTCSYPRSDSHPQPMGYYPLTIRTSNPVIVMVTASSTNRRRACMLTVMGSGGS
jgi:hypothetical protein